MPRSFLSSEENYRFIKGMHEKNLIVPVSGDFGGPKAIRAIGKYLQENGATVTAFYLSNVEQYLYDDKWDTFCRSVSTLPLDTSSTFIRSQSRFAGSFVSSLGQIVSEIKACAGR